MKELFEQLLKLRCTEIHLTRDECRVSLLHGPDGTVLTVSHPDPLALAVALKAYSEAEA